MTPSQSQAIDRYTKSAAMNAEQTVKALEKAKTRRNVEAILVARNKGELWELAKYYGTLRIPSDRKADLVHRIADATAGYRERMAIPMGNAPTEVVVTWLKAADDKREAREILFGLMRDQVLCVCATMGVHHEYNNTKQEMVETIIQFLGVE